MHRSPAQPLTTADHARDSAGLMYVYPVLSRRSGGISIGINLNPNRACNWRCLYCQVPDLVRGSAPAIDRKRLKTELDGFLYEVISGDFYNRYAVAKEARVIKDIAISGDGEPTSAPAFDRVVAVVIEAMRDAGLPDATPLILITNGSLLHRANVKTALSLINDINGEVWFKLDTTSDRQLRIINHAKLSMKRVKDNLSIATARCHTWLQTCVFQLDGKVLLDETRAEYLRFLASSLAAGLEIKGVLLYGLARPSMQAEAQRLSPAPKAWMRSFADAIRRLGVTVRLTL